MIGQTTTHQTLLERLAHAEGAANSAAWEEFLARYADLIRHFCRARGLPPSDSDDVLQDVLLSLSRSMPGFRYDPVKGRFRGYLKTVTLHAIFRKARQTHPAHALDADMERIVAAASSDASIDEQWEHEWRQHHVRRAMQTIASEFSARDLAAFQAYAVEGRPADAVRSEHSLSPDALYQIKSRIMRRLSDVVAAQVADEG